MSWWSPSSGKTGSTTTPAAFRWSPEKVTSFLRGFHDSSGISRLDLEVHLSHERLDHDSWSMACEDRFFGWCQLGYVRAEVPVQVTIERSGKVYEDRTHKEWSVLTALGHANLWKRGLDDLSDHGIEVNLRLDDRRYSCLRRRLRENRAPFPARLTVALRYEQPGTAPALPDDSRSAEAYPPFPILAYWLITYPHWQSGSATHPWLME